MKTGIMMMIKDRYIKIVIGSRNPLTLINAKTQGFLDKSSSKTERNNQ